MYTMRVTVFLHLCVLFQSLCVGSGAVVGRDVRLDCYPGAHDMDIHNPDPAQAPDTFIVTFKTTSSTDAVVLEVHREWSPLGVDRFYQLVLDNFFTCASFFRIVPNFVVQFGLAAEPEETSKWGDVIADDAVLKSNLKSYVSFATAGANTRTTQVFFNLRDNPSLDAMGFSPFAKVVEGMDVVESLMNPTPGSSDGVDQGLLESEGNAWLFTEYPDIDIILSTAHIGPQE